ncbi:ABC transporter substrate-binding protein [Balneatrix alpica]|uniref:ABC transporter substrate-binding protein n=1 Tax=Balneatrix alpica TaxID=75684 RepID=A0ABV5ZC86_9GAMM|nr:ABC transporter substrate-binding protein [Balneatrix alpica]
MRKPSLLLLAISASLTLTAEARPLTVVGWGGAAQQVQDQVYFQPWQQASKQELLQDSYSGGLAKVKAMVDTQTVTWDVITVEDPELQQGCETGLFEAIDWSKVGEPSNFVEGATSECGVGSYVWSNVLAYNTDQLKDGPQNWADFWNVEKYPGKRGLRKGAKANLEFALMADGVAPNDVYGLLRTEAGVDRAFAKLAQLKPHIQWWEAGAQPPEWLASGDVVMTSAYNGRITAANKEGKAFKVVWTGQVYSVDSFAVLKGSENKAAAMDFIAFASQPANQEKYPLLIPYGPTNKEAIAKLAPEVAETLPTHTPNLAQALREDTEFWLDYQDELNERFNAWVAQ